MSLISRLSAAEDQGGVMGLVQSLNSLARIIGPLYGGFTFDHFGIGTPFVSAAAFMAGTAVFATFALWRARNELAASSGGTRGGLAH